MMVGWLSGTAFGAGAGGFLPDPQALGLDLVLAAFAAAMMTAMVKSPASLIPVAVGAGAALAIGFGAGPGWAVVGAGLAGAVVAAALWQPAGGPP